MTRTSKKHMFCIGHTKLSLNIPESAYLIRTTRGFLKENAHPNLVALDEISEELDFYYPYLGGTAGLLAIPEVFRIKKIPHAAKDKILIFQQAKVVTPRSIGWESKNYPGMKVLPPWLAQGIDIQKVSDLAGDFLFPQPLLQSGGEFNAYAHYHHLPDLLRFCAVAIDEGVLTSLQVVELSRQEIVIPGGGFLGESPLDYFLVIAESLKKVALAFLAKHRPGLTSPYQRLAAGYCIERVTSYLLVKKLLADYGEIPGQFVGNMIAVSSSEYVGGSSNFDK